MKFDLKKSTLKKLFYTIVDSELAIQTQKQHPSVRTDSSMKTELGSLLRSSPAKQPRKMTGLILR